MVFTAALSILSIRFCTRIGLLDLPQGRKQHQRPTPLCGGLVLWVMLSVLSLLGFLDLGLSRWDWVGLHTMALVGLMDDKFGMSARYKGLVGLSVAALLAATHGLFLLKLGGTFPVLGLDLPNVVYITLPLLLLWFWFLPQAINLMDGVNGLVIGFSLLVLWFLGAPSILLLSLGVILLFNYPRARLFLGDCGALLLGTLMAILVVKGRLPQSPNSFFVLFLYPMVDVSLVVLLRWLNRQPLGVGDRRHVHHRTVDALGKWHRLAPPWILAGAVFPAITMETQFFGEQNRWVGVAVFLGLFGLLFVRSWKPRSSAFLRPMGRDV